MTAREMKREPKNERGGRGRGRKETLADKPLDFENLPSPANAAPDWLDWSNKVDMCRSKVCVILRGHVWYVTLIFLRLLFILVGKNIKIANIGVFAAVHKWVLIIFFG